MREVIEEAKRIAATEKEFIARLALYNVTLTRSKTEYSYLHPQKQKSIRGKRLGENYSKEVIKRVIAENGHGRNELQELNERTRQETENALLKEALAISNEKSNDLIRQQNKLVAELRADIATTEYSLTDTVKRAVKEMQSATAKTERLNLEIAAQVRKTVSTSVNELKAEIAAGVNETLSKVKTKMERTEKEIARQRERLRVEGRLRKFFFWATPFLLLAQTIAIIILSL